MNNHPRDLGLLIDLLKLKLEMKMKIVDIQRLAIMLQTMTSTVIVN
jgi:hypothetical protein